MNFLYRNIGIVLFLLLIQSYAIAQVHQLQLKTPNGDPIGFLSILCESRQFNIMSDADGWVLLDTKKYHLTDTLTFTSIFYQELKMPFSKLLEQKELVLQHTVVEIDDIIVSPPLFAENLVKEMSEFFSRNYAKDYASSVTHLRTIECNGRYCEFTGLQGVFFSTDFNQSYNKLYFMDRNSLNWVASSVMRSDPFIAGSDRVLSKWSIHLPYESPIESFSKESMNIEYNDYPDQTALVMKRSLEIFSPLNPAQLKNFTYLINSSYKRGEEKIYVIHFSTKDKFFPKRTRIYGKGILYYNATTKLVEKIIMENHQDYYTMFPRSKVNKLLPSATRHIIEVAYTYQNKQIFTKSVRLNVVWVDPQVDKNFYMMTLSPRRNPIKNNLKEFEYYEYDRFVSLDKNKRQQVMSYVPQVTWDKLYYIAPFDPKVWAKIKWTGIDKKRLFAELSLPNMSLLQQAEKNGIDPQFFYGVKNESNKYRVFNSYRNAPRIYQIIYGNNNH